MLRLLISVFGEFQMPPIDLEYELKRVDSFTMDASTLETMPRKTGEKKLKLRVMCFRCLCVFVMLYFISFDALNSAPLSLDNGSRIELSPPVPQI